jgi:3D (Asp-Asp-Asp) domain-containing protein
MRIIRSTVALSILFMVIAPQVTLAAAASMVNSNETNINFKIEDSLVIDNGVIREKNSALLTNTLSTSNVYVPVKTKEEIEREKVLAKYEERRKNANLPKGKFTINASAYTAAADECGKSDGITASGLKVKEGVTIACPPQFPFGVKIKIEGMGTRICEDRGGAIKANHIDIYMETKKDAFSFGRQNLEAEVVM